MAETSTRVRYTGQQVLAFLDEEEDGMEDTFFPGSDDDLGMNVVTMKAEMIMMKKKEG